MKKYLLIIVITISSLYCQSDDIPFDWGGQYGVISNNGRLMWNQDWAVGVLLMDGTFSNYPTRFGSSYKNNLLLSSIGDFYKGFNSFPDSSQIKSRIDYYRGDFSYDQLEIDTEFSEKNRVIALNGFKRTYKGPYGQFADPQGGNNPLQQSYRLDYSSKDNDELLDISVGYFITDSRLNLNDPADFNHNEKIVSAGIGYSNNFAMWKYKIHGALFQQHYEMSFDSTRAYLNRIHLNQLVSKKLPNSSLLKLGLELDNQGLSIVDSTTKKERLWSTIYGGWEKQSYGIKLGTTIAQDEIVPFFNIFAQSKIGKTLKWNSFLKYEAVPEHIFNWYRDIETLFEKWTTAHIDVEYQWKNMPISLNIDYNNFKCNEFLDDIIVCGYEIDLSDNFLSSSIATQIPIFREWKIDAEYRHTFEDNLYSEGIGDRVKIGLIVTEKLFKNNMLAQMRLWGDAYLNHHPNLVYNGFHYGQYYHYDTSLAIPDYWVFNMELLAKISNMTISWKMNNILQTAESITSQLFPNIEDKYLLITNSNNFPPMSRFVTFNIVWNFDS